MRENKFRHKYYSLQSVMLRSKRCIVLWLTSSFILYWISLSLPALRKKLFRCELSKVGQFALYSYNFGNYRNELNGIQDILLSFNKYGIDSYFFTNRQIPPVNGWDNNNNNNTIRIKSLLIAVQEKSLNFSSIQSLKNIGT